MGAQTELMTHKLDLRFVGLFAVSVAMAGCVAQPKGPSQAAPESMPLAPQAAVAIPADLQSAVSNAEMWGDALYDSYVAPKGTNSAAVEQAIETVHDSVKDHCAGTYRAIVVMPAGAPTDRIVIYDIGEVPAPQGLMIGRHYRIETTLDGKGVLLGEPSTSGCVTLPPVAGDTASVISDDLTPTPSEYHVFLSLLSGRRLEVVTVAGQWLVEQGKISYRGRT